MSPGLSKPYGLIVPEKVNTYDGQTESRQAHLVSQQNSVTETIISQGIFLEVRTA